LEEEKIMKIDMHVHMHRTSNCAKDEPEVMAATAVKVGLKGIVLLDHNYHTSRVERESVERLIPGIKVFRGVELNVLDDDVVIVTNAPMNLPKYKEKVTDIKMLADWVKETNSLAILSHPFRRHDISFDLNVFCPQAVELASRHIVRENRAKIAEVAKQYKMKVVSVSDAHKERQLGGFCIETDYDVNTEEELGEVVKKGDFTLMETKLVPVDTYARNEFII
jgi:predicted metal-dependent phosphoesterase TrpH